MQGDPCHYCMGIVESVRNGRGRWLLMSIPLLCVGMVVYECFKSAVGILFLFCWVGGHVPQNAGTSFSYFCNFVIVMFVCLSVIVVLTSVIVNALAVGIYCHYP